MDEYEKRKIILSDMIQAMTKMILEVSTKGLTDDTLTLHECLITNRTYVRHKMDEYEKRKIILSDMIQAMTKMILEVSTEGLTDDTLTLHECLLLARSSLEDGYSRY